MTTRRNVIIGMALVAPLRSAAIARAVAGPSTEPFSTLPSNSSFGSKGGSTTSGLQGTKTSYPNGRVIIQAREHMTAWRAGGFEGSLVAACHREFVRGVWTVTQRNYAYRRRVSLPSVTLWEEAPNVPVAPSSFRALAAVDAVASQFG